MVGSPGKEKVRNHRNLRLLVILKNFLSCLEMIIDYPFTVDRFEAAITGEEKQKMFEAIGYSEGDLPLESPEEFVNVRLQFHLNKLEVKLIDEKLDHNVISVAALHSVKSTMEKRSSASAIK